MSSQQKDAQKDARHKIGVYEDGVYEDGFGTRSNFFLFEKPKNLSQVVADQALINPATGQKWQSYNRYIEVEIPAGEYVHMGYAAKMTDKAPGGGTQIWLDDDVVNNAIDWDAAEATARNLPQH